MTTASPEDIAIAAARLAEETSHRCDDLDTRLKVLEGRKGFLYQFKIVPELGWSVLVAVGTVLAQGATDAEKVSDWRAWAIGLTAGLVRAVIGAILAYRAGTVQKS